MDRKKKLMLNSIMSLIYQGLTLICGFILPRFFLKYYGSAVNGLVSSITQFLGFIVICESGVGAVVQSTFYKPLADNDKEQVSRIFVSSDRFFRKLAIIMVVYTVILMVIYPFGSLESFDYFFTFTLIFVISISTFAQYYFGMTYKLLLFADQLSYRVLAVQCGALLSNAVSCIVLMTLGLTIQLVKLCSSVIFLIQPLIVISFAKRIYHIDRSVALIEEPIKQKWNGLAQHVAAVVLNNTDTMVLTILSTLENVSIYAVHNMVLTGVDRLVDSLTAGMRAMLGNMLAKGEMEELKKTFRNTEWLLHTVTVLVFGCTAVLIVPFISVYTNGIQDANYYQPLFAILITMAHAGHCLRLPYNILILAAGHFKQTQRCYVIAAVLNIIISVACVFFFGLIGVAIGTLVAMVYQTIWMAIYDSKNIIAWPFKIFIKQIVVDLICIVVGLFLSGQFTLGATTYFAWVIMAIKVGLIWLVVVSLVNFIFYRENMIRMFGKITKKGKRE